MAVVKGKSDLIPDPYNDAAVPPDPVRARGRMIVAQGTVANLSTDNTNSMYHLADLPADCILDPSTAFQVQSWGFAQVVIGTQTDTDALLDVARNAANVQNPVAFGDANHGKELWEQLGLAARPESNVISIWAHAEGNATGAGSLKFRIAYLYR